MSNMSSLPKKLKRIFFLSTFGIRNLIAKLRTGQITLRSMRQQLRTQRAAFAQFPEEYRTASRRFSRYIMRHYPDQFPFIAHYITMGYHYYMFTFDHVVPGITELLSKEAATDDNSLPAHRVSAA